MLGFRRGLYQASKQFQAKGLSCNKNMRFLNLHEYQAAQLLEKYEVPILMGSPAFKVSEAIKVAKEISLTPNFQGIVVKAQVHAGGRGRGSFKESGLQGGVHLLDNVEQVNEYAPKMLGNTLITKQTGEHGKPCNALYLVEKVSMERELYISIMLDRSRACPVLICSSVGGMGVEDLEDGIIKTFEINPEEGLTKELVQKAVDAFKLPPKNRIEAEKVIRGIYNCFIENESTMVEVNPLALLTDGRLLVCDTKIRIDDSAAFRHKELFAMDDLSQKDPSEVAAAKWDLNYVKLDGNIGCLVNGAGLAMGTMDYIKFNGGEPANFLDVGGTSTVERVFEAIRLINNDKKVDSILVNIFGGIVKCDIIVEGVQKAVKELGVKKPIVMRIKGTNAEKAAEMVRKSGLDLHWELNVKDAVAKAVSLASK